MSDRRGRNPGLDRKIFLKPGITVLWVTEAQYAGGSLYRMSYNNLDDFEKSVAFLRDKANTEWVRGHRVEVHISWEEVTNDE